MSTATITNPAADVAEPIAGRSLIPAEDFDRLVAQIRKDRPDFDENLAVASADQALALVATMATRPDVHMGPSDSVDAGWHALLHGDTRVYHALCDRLGMFVHHVPDEADDHDLQPGEDTDGLLSRTAHAIRAAGYFVDPYMWGTRYAKMHGDYVPGCHPDQDSGSGCHCGNAC